MLHVVDYFNGHGLSIIVLFWNDKFQDDNHTPVISRPFMFKVRFEQFNPLF